MMESGSDVVNSEELVHEKLFLFSGMILGAKMGQRYPKVAFLKKQQTEATYFSGRIVIKPTQIDVYIIYPDTSCMECLPIPFPLFMWPFFT